MTQKTVHVNALLDGVGRNATRHVLQERLERIVPGSVTVQMECIVIHRMENVSVLQERKDTNAMKLVKMGSSEQVVREYVPVRMVEFVIR